MMLLAPLASVALAEQADSTVAAPNEYRIGISDKLRVSVWREEDVSLPVIVRPDGKITVPLVGDVLAAGRTATDITQEIAQALKKYIKEPIVTVIVEEINSNTIYVIGEVNRQGAIELQQRTRFLQAIAMAGGLTEFADKSRVVLLREENGREVVRELDFKKLIRGEAPEENVYLRPGDTIIVY
jgi:polysaccharide export outer membrane protein